MEPGQWVSEGLLVRVMYGGTLFARDRYGIREGLLGTLKLLADGALVKSPSMADQAKVDLGILNGCEGGRRLQRHEISNRLGHLVIGSRSHLGQVPCGS